MESERDSRFWELIGHARSAGNVTATSPPQGFLRRLLGPRRVEREAGQSAMVESLKASLKAMPADDIIAFKIWLEQQLDRAYRADLWDAAYLLCGGCSDDSFEYFRAWLVAQGREAFERALQDPESLADLPITDDPSSECEFEDLLYLPADAYKEMGFGNLYDALPKRDAPQELAGELSDEAALPTKYPRIAARWQ